MYILLGGVLLVLSCSKNDCTLTPSYAEGQENHQEERLGISPLSLRITPKEAAIVACIERFGTTVKMNRIEGEVESVDSICNSLGRALMYVVQYSDYKGYTVVSSTKNYYPILVDVEYGEYNPEVIAQSGASLFYDAYREEIEQSNSQDSNSIQQIRSQWYPFEEISKSTTALTKSTSDELLDLVESSIAEWEAEGYNYYFLGQCPNNLPEDVYNRFVEIASELSNENYDFMDNCVILEQRQDSETLIGPLMTTSWSQHQFYFHGPYVWTGCGPLAIAQIMAYHRHPTNIQWDLVFTQAADRKTFIENVAIEMGARFGTTGTSIEIDDAMRYLSTKGYLRTQTSHNTQQVYTSLVNGRPVYMQGEDDNNIAHAWVCDGYNSETSSFRYELKVLSYFSPLTYETADSYSTSTNRTRYHMNWGENTLGLNGFYHDATIRYNRTRDDIVNIRPIAMEVL